MSITLRPDQKRKSVFQQLSEPICNFIHFPHNATNDFAYDHQKDAVLVAKTQLDLPTPSIALVVLPTGCGKTGVAVLAAYALNARRVLVVTPSVKISEQIYEAFCGSTRKPMFLRQREIIGCDDEDDFKPSATPIKNSKEISRRLHDDLMIINAHKVGGSSSVPIDAIPTHYDLVIVDEAHHYPAPTWKNLVDHFSDSKRLFLTATPLYKGKPILPKHPVCYELSRQEAVEKNIIRPLEFVDEVNCPGITNDPALAIALTIMECLDKHDAEDPDYRHQAMVLTQTIRDQNAAELFQQAYEQHKQESESLGATLAEWDRFEAYHGESDQKVLERFDAGEFRGLVVVGKLREGYDNNRISVVGIARNVSLSSKVLFAQFVGRAVRKLHPDDPVTATIISHPKYKQRRNYEEFDKVREGEDIEEED